MKAGPAKGPCVCGAEIFLWKGRCDACKAKSLEARVAAAKAKTEYRLQRLAARRRPRRTGAENQWREAVGRITHQAVTLGLLPHPAECICVDCGADAECFDHRDYSKPLEVDPVCISCNSSRHRGQMPAAKTPADFPMSEQAKRYAELYPDRNYRAADTAERPAQAADLRAA